MSLFIKQRNAMWKEHNEILPLVKTISKLKQKNTQNQKPIVLRDLLALVSVPRPLPIFIKSSVELKLALQCPEDRCLGGLRENPCTYNYKVCRTDQYKDLFFFTLEQYDKQQFSKDQVCQMIKQMNDQYTEEALQCIENRFKILENYQSQPFLSDLDLQEFENLVGQYPYQCTIQNVDRNRSVLSQRIINKKFLDMMGITKEMMFDHLKEHTALPTIFDLDGSLKNWCDLAKYSLQGTKNFQFQINTYEGNSYKCDVEQKQMFKRFNNNPDSVVFIEFRIIKADEFVQKQLFREDRIYKNHLDYFNEKNTSLEFNKFKNLTKYVDAKQYQTTKPCGYKTKSLEEVQNKSPEIE